MHIKRIKLHNFRNYAALDLCDIKEGINVIYGENAQGKTNLLEAVNICANGKSFRVNTDSKTIRFSCERAYINVEYEKSGITSSIEVLIEKNKKKGIKINGIPADTVKQLIGNLYSVIFSPEDIKMVKEAPGLRRSFLDLEISKIRPSYIDALKKYTEIIAQKNAALKKHGDGVDQILRAYNKQLAAYIKIIVNNRISYVNKLNEYVGGAQHYISGGNDQIEIEYKATIRPENVEENLDKIVGRELFEKSCIFGPHRDDMVIRVNGRDIRTYASQGQLRTLVLSIKIACIKILEDATGHTPVFLLDDVFSELDHKRKENLIKQIAGMQVFITTTQIDPAVERGDINYLKVEKGIVRKMAP